MSTKEWQEVGMESSEVWDRQKAIEGTLKQVKTDVGANGSMMYMLETKDGVVSVWGSTVLDRKFESVPTGSKVRIEPRGEAKSEKTGRTYQDYGLFFIPPQFKEVDTFGDGTPVPTE